MTKKKGRIGVTGLVSVLFVCRAMTLFTFLQPENTGLRQGDRPLLAFSFFLFGMLASLPLFYLRKDRPRSLLDVTDGFSKRFTKICCVLFSGYLLWSAAFGEARFTLLTGTVLLRGVNNVWPVMLLTLTAGIVALKGLEAIGRASGVIAVLLISTVIFVLISTANRFDVTNLEAPLKDGPGMFAVNGFHAAARTPELFVPLLLGESLSGNIRKGIPFFLIFFGVTAGVVFLFISGVLGAYGEGQILPLYTLTTLAKSGVLERLDNVLSGLWVLCAVLRSAFFVKTASGILCRAFAKSEKKTVVLCCAAVAGTALVLSESETRLMKTASSGISDVCFIVFLILVPSVLLLSEHRKKIRYSK